MLGAAFCLAALIALGTGPVPIGPLDVLSALAGQPHLAQHEIVIHHLRLPRALLAVSVGASLAVSGAALQGLFRNPLADPALVGVSSGAVLGAVSVIVLGSTVLTVFSTLFAAWAVPVAAFIGALTVTAIIYRLAQSEYGTHVTTLLLAGIAINAIAMAGVGLLTFIADDNQLRTLTFWNLGSLGGATWQSLAVALPLVWLPLLWLMRQADALNALALGEAEAGHLGFDTRRLKRRIVVCVALSVGCATGLTGLIGFVGLLLPHLVRLALGPDHRALLPCAAVGGATLMLLADSAARTVAQPAELPIGIITALLGGPVFLWLLVRQKMSGAI
ncbi:MAG: iron ABC transporter permease [Pseudomonadota bacterium]